MKVFVLCAGVMLAATPGLADVKPTGIMWMRDSDGIVISVLHPGDYGPWYTNLGGIGGVIYTMDGHVLEFSAGPGGPVTSMSGSGTLGPTAMVDGTAYKVEVSGQDVWLRDPATGILHPTERRMAKATGAEGLAVNPNGFALD